MVCTKSFFFLDFDDNGFAWFWNYQKSRPGEPLWDNGMARQESLIQALDQDLAALDA